MKVTFAFFSALLLSSCVPPNPGIASAGAGAAPNNAARDSSNTSLSITWDVIHEWETRQWANTPVFITVNGDRQEVGEHASKEAPIVPVKRGSWPRVVPPGALSVATSSSSGGQVYYYAVDEGDGNLGVYRFYIEAGRDEENTRVEFLRFVAL